MAKGRVKRGVTKGQLMKVEGMDGVLAEIEKRLDRVTGEAIKDALIEAGKPLWSQAKKDIAALKVSDRMKEILDAEVAMMRGKKKQPKIMVGMSQAAGKRKLGRNRRSINPYWVEFGTQERTGPPHPVYGTKRGRMKPFPFFRNALEKAKPEIAQALASQLKEIIET
jgi:hypothetical protein